MNYTFRFAPVFHRFDQLMDGLVVTLWVSLAVIFLGLIVGIVGALAMRSRFSLVRGLMQSYVELIRNTPLLAQLFFIYFGLPSLGIKLDSFVAAVIALTVNLGAYTTEIIRGGIDSVPAGQTEAGIALGLSRLQIFFLIVLKPAVKTMFPALASQCTLLILGTSLISQLGIPDLFRAASQIDLDTYLSFEVYLVMCAIYVTVVLLFRAACAVIYRLMFAEREPTPLTLIVSPS
jgi:polar amino acid transport system permease protein